MAERDDAQLEELIARGADSALGRALREAEARRLPETAGVDAAVMAAARRELRDAARRRLVWRIGAPLAAAAAIGIAASVVFWRADEAAVPRNVIAGDVDGSGGVDILDAYMLARSLEQAEALPAFPGTDANGDGVVDRRDVEALAMRAVSLDGGRG